MRSPRFLRWLASALLPSRHREFVLGDLEELYARRCRRRGRALAGVWYLWDLLRSVASGLAGRPAGGRVLDSNSGGLWRDRGSAARSDLRHALRSLRRRPTFTALVVGTIALGVGPATVVFGMVNELLLRPLPGVPNTDRAVHVVVSRPNDFGGISFPDLQSLRQDVGGFEGIAAYFNSGLNVIPDDDRPIRIEAEVVYGDFFRVLGVRPAEGHLLSSRATDPNADPFVVVISENLRNRLFGPEGDATGSALHTTAGQFTIVGVAGGGFRGSQRTRPVDAWLLLGSLIPLIGYTSDLLRLPGRPMYSRFLALPTEGTTSEALKAEVQAALGRIASGSPESAEYLADQRARIVPGLHLGPLGRERTETTLMFMGWAVALILAIACANVANLLLFRNLSRRGAIATQRVLGASSWRIARSQLIESVLLGSIGAAGALAVA